MDEKKMVDSARRILLHDAIEAFSGNAVGYRNRVDLVFFKDGLGMRGSFDSFVDVTRSELANDRINTIIAQVRERFVGFDPFIQKTKRGTLRYAVIRSLDTSSISFVLNARGDIDSARDAIASFAATSDVENILITLTEPESDVSVGSEYELIKGSDVLEASLAGAQLKVHVQGFFQNNLVMADAMHRFIREGLGTTSGTLIDLYGGVGSFACTLGSSFERAIVIEEHEGAAALAADNLERNGVRGETVCADASVLARYGSKQVTVITDPPRIGMSEKAIRALARLRPDRIVYVSCNPIIAPRDLTYLRGYRIERVGVFDMFPGTDHFEMVVVLSRDRVVSC
jgi:23S rRNA (uracil1939-C5)-methyltransferase